MNVKMERHPLYTFLYTSYIYTFLPLICCFSSGIQVSKHGVSKQSLKQTQLCIALVSYHSTYFQVILQSFMFIVSMKKLRTPIPKNHITQRHTKWWNTYFCIAIAVQFTIHNFKLNTLQYRAWEHFVTFNGLHDSQRKVTIFQIFTIAQNSLPPIWGLIPSISKDQVTGLKKKSKPLKN